MVLFLVKTLRKLGRIVIKSEVPQSAKIQKVLADVDWQNGKNN